MKRTTLRKMKCGIIMTVVILMISVVPVTAQSVTAQDEAPERSLVGVWLVKIAPRNCTTRDLGWSDYSFKYVFIRRNLTTGLFAGKQESFGTLVLSESGDEFTTDSDSIGYSVDGIPGPLNCANAVGTRFKLEP